MARQRLGQHFLADLDWREQIARAIRVSPHSTAPLPGDEQHCWIEIGSGHGEITRNLLGAGGPVYAIELDPPLVAGVDGTAGPEEIPRKTFPISPSCLAIFSKRISPRSQQAGACASTEISPTTSPRPS